MKVFLTGGTGFIGRHVVRALLDRGAECVVVSRSGRDPWGDPRVRVVRGDPTRSGPWQAAVGGADAAVNLAGMPIVEPPHRWTQARKATIRASRVETTLCLVEAMRAASGPREYVSASKPLLALLENLTRRSDCNQIYIQKDGLSVTLEKRAGFSAGNSI